MHKNDGDTKNRGGGDHMPQRRGDKKQNNVLSNKRQEEKQPGYGDKKLEGPDRPST
jgi:hypothetical protein